MNTTKTATLTYRVESYQWTQGDRWAIIGPDGNIAFLTPKAVREDDDADSDEVDDAILSADKSHAEKVCAILNGYAEMAAALQEAADRLRVSNELLETLQGVPSATYGLNQHAATRALACISSV